MRLKLYRGFDPENKKPQDPGDFGRGPYWTSSKAQARAYGPVVKCRILEFKRPCLLTVEEAYDLAEEFGTLSGGGSRRIEDRFRCSQEMTSFMVSLGYDGMVIEHDRPKFMNNILEVVDYRPCQYLPIEN